MVDVKATDREKEVVLEAPAGIIRATAHLSEPFVVDSVSFKNVPAFLYKKDVTINVPDLGQIKLDVSFGGSFFAILPIKEVNEKIEPKNSEKLAEVGMKILKAANEQIKVQHPTMPYINTIDLVEMYGEPKSKDATMQNVVVFGDGQVDRSPCGTGTSAKMATLYAKHELGLHEKFVYESILNTKFTGQVLEETKVGNQKAVIPEVTGSAYITGFNTLLFDPKDPLSEGFILK